MTRLSANLGFLWTSLDLPTAIHAAAHAGFKAVECHWPYDTQASAVIGALEQTGLPMLGLNTLRGDVAAGDNGVAAIVGREAEARQYIDQAIEYASQIDCSNVHVMAGITDKSGQAQNTYVENLLYAARQAHERGLTILIEPLNHYDAPGYHLSTLDEALSTLNSVGAPNLKIMFDCYHMQIMHGDLTRRLDKHMAQIGHIQIAAVPDRGEPDGGEIHYPNLLRAFDDMGWSGYIGAEYKPRIDTDSGIQWMDHYR